MNNQFFTSLNGYKVKDEYALHTYDTVGNMKADTKLKEGMHVKTKGYYNANDGGSAEYLIRNKSNNDLEDNGSIHFVQNNLVAELILENNVTPEQFGCYGDDEHDDTIAFQNMLNKSILDYIFFSTCCIIILGVYMKSIYNITFNELEEYFVLFFVKLFIFRVFFR